MRKINIKILTLIKLDDIIIKVAERQCVFSEYISKNVFLVLY